MIALATLALAACTDKAPADTGDTDTSPGGDTGQPADTGNGPDGGSVVDNTCAPDDGAGLSFTFGLAQQECGGAVGTSAYLRIEIWTPRQGPVPAGTELRWNAEEGTGEATYKANASAPWDYGLGGWVRVDAWDQGGDVSGEYEVRLESGAVITDTFTSPFCDSPTKCG